MSGYASMTPFGAMAPPGAKSYAHSSLYKRAPIPAQPRGHLTAQAGGRGMRDGEGVEVESLGLGCTALCCVRAHDVHAAWLRR
jgi:hypothetical protein